MKKNFILFIILLSGIFVATSIIKAGATAIDFEDLFEFDSVANHYQALGPTFTNATVLTAGSSLNEFEFPPYSGVNVIYDDSAPIQIDFSTPVSEIGAYLTYMIPVTINAYDASSNLVGSYTSSFSSNMALSGDSGSSPNEYFTIAYAGGISSVAIVGDSFGGSFVLDDINFETASVTPVPEPNTIIMLLTGLMGIAIIIGGTRKKFLKRGEPTPQ